jgi:hypothetical protein
MLAVPANEPLRRFSKCHADSGLPVANPNAGRPRPRRQDRAPSRVPAIGFELLLIWPVSRRADTACCPCSDGEAASGGNARSWCEVGDGFSIPLRPVGISQCSSPSQPGCQELATAPRQRGRSTSHAGAEAPIGKAARRQRVANTLGCAAGCRLLRPVMECRRWCILRPLVKR